MPCLLALLVVSLAVIFPGVSSAQDTNFATGPQYLANYGSPLFLHSLTTPTLSLDSPPQIVTPEEQSGGSAMNAFGGFRNLAAINRVYWGVPTISAEETVTVVPEPRETASEVELTSEAPPQPIPTSITDVGTIGLTSAQTLSEQGYGIPLGQAAAYWKANKPKAVHTFTNADVARLHGG